MRKILFLFLILSFNSFSQSIDLGELKTLENTFVDKKNKELFVFYSNDSLSIIDLTTLKEKSKSKISYPKKDFNLKFPIINIDSQVYFLHPLGGLVFRLKNDKISRIDKSYDHRMQISSTIFPYNDTIYRYGGYGFWSHRNFFTYFNKTTKDWRIIPPKGSDVLPKGSHSSIITVDKNTIYVYGGISTDEFNPLNFIENKEVWKFESNKKSWKNLGSLESNLPEFEHFIPYKNKQIFIDESNTLYLLDVVNNQLKTYEKKPIQEKIVSSMHSFYMDGVFYCFVTENDNETKIKLITISEDDFFDKLIREGSVYYNNERVYYFIGFLFLVVISIPVYRILRSNYRNRNKIIIDKGKLIFNKRIIPLDETRVSIIKLLLTSTEEVTLSDIMEIHNKKDLNYGHNTRVIKETIEEINFKISSTLGITKDVINSKKSDLDKRIKSYSIDKSYFNVK
ncbi:hypothetical protein [Maribacter sp. ACAM166]|uniref:hypothetical protein n=1 Tax=Maribacter sp. ACAM166 TaxID=2508996 RepID=UPI0010FEA3A4|nr:hypothetical protein [Maribacter sp. ACAM166]TLP73250.1 hypothetical protein ES765_17455 [Maribacter sp. ACAM166]